MRNKLYIVEGADGTGKSTLCNAIREKTKGHLLHGSYKSDWNIKKYHGDMLESANLLFKYQSTIFDRWSVSEEVYSNAFRGGSNYSADDFMINMFADYGAINFSDVVFIYCENENTIKNHKENVKNRPEMFDDMTKVVHEYDKYLDTTNIKWNRYDFNKINMEEFVGEITS